MRSRKPDLLIVLAMVLALGVVVTTYGGGLLGGLDVEAQPFHKAMQISASR